ncbi:helix-turn-helix domain-containing protein [Clostridium sp. AWRP]|uniref:helix-turn-helix transcriptional regulator n=1 Tax=Clostridium sp. AWRP TaxID=2212991 RepID=UPI000FDA9BFB|nr:helix-turn-helix domain-containing protein [Clostridium sp. AWRP]AZV57954.1 helix-turn-helix domain-containing protein [Clostridium sp. AWRP]
MYQFNSKNELFKFLSGNIINTNEAKQILGCTRQNIDDLVKRGKLVPIKVFPRDRLFLKEDVLNRVDK